MKTMRTFVLSFLVTSLIAFGLPVQESLARWSRRSAVSHRRGNHRHCRHSRAWWRRHRARVRERQERARLRRLRRETESRARRNESANDVASLSGPRVFRKTRTGTDAPPVQGPRNPYDFARPSSWSLTRAQTPGSLTFAVGSPQGNKAKASAKATLAPVVLTGAGAAADVISPRTKTLGGIALPALRRTVIERMVVEGGWVVNDMEREFQGRRVYIVIAHTGQSGAAQESLTFYFTEIDGQLYSLATRAPVEQAAPVAADAERVMASLRKNGAGNKALMANSKP